MGLELERQYVAQGRYGASIETEIEDLPRNRVNVKIDIEEGKSSGIRHINFVGNSAFNEVELLDSLNSNILTLVFLSQRRQIRPRKTLW